MKRSIFSRRQQNSLHVVHFLSPHTRDSLRNRTLWIKGTASSEKEPYKTSPVQIDSATQFVENFVGGKFRGTQGEPGKVVPHGNNPLYSSSSTARCGPTFVTVHARLVY